MKNDFTFNFKFQNSNSNFVFRIEFSCFQFFFSSGESFFQSLLLFFGIFILCLNKMLTLNIFFSIKYLTYSFVSLLDKTNFFSGIFQAFLECFTNFTLLTQFVASILHFFFEFDNFQVFLCQLFL